MACLILWQACSAVLAGDAARSHRTDWQPHQPRKSTHGSWRIQSFLEDAGLTGRFAFFVDFDREGNVWIASSEGLVFYDGYTWTRFSEDDGLPSNFVRCLQYARDGRLWIGTNKGIAVRDAQGRISIPENTHLAGPNVRRIVEDPDGTLWFCSDTWLVPGVPAGLASHRQGTWTVYRQDNGLPSDYVSDYFRDSAGRQFVLSRDGLAVRNGDSWTRPLEAAGLAGHNDYFWSIVETPLFGVAATSGHAVFVLKDSQWSRIETSRPELGYLKLAALSDGDIVTLSGEYDAPKRFEGWTGSDFIPLTEPFHVPGDATHVTEAPDGSVWAVGWDLLVRWVRSSSEWAEYPDISTPMLVDKRGRVWFTTGETILRLTGDNKWESLPYAVHTIAPGRDADVLGFSTTTVFRFTSDDVVTYGPELTGVHSIRGHALDALGRAWLHGTDRDGHNVIGLFDGGSWHVQAPPEIQHGGFGDHAPDPAGGVYYLIFEESSRRPRLVRIDGDGIGAIGLPDAVTGYTLELHVDYRGCPWLFGHFGLFTLVEGVWQHIENIPGERVFGAANGRDETWFAYDGAAGGRTGLGRFSNGAWSYLNLDARLRVCGRDPDGDVFFGTKGVVYGVMGESGGAPASLTLPVQRIAYSALRGPTGDVWVGLGDGVFRYRPDGVPPQTLIVDAESAVQEGNSLAVTLAGVERFRSRGEGAFDYSWRINSQPWTEFGPAPAEGLATSLSPGQYTLEVRARDQGHDIDPTPARVRFRVAAMPWPQRPWFWPLATAVLVGLALMGVAAVIARYRAQYHTVKLERVVNERTARLRESEARFRAMTAAAPIPIVITREADGTILYANPLMGEILGLPDDELIGRRVQEFFGSPHARRRLLAEVLKVGYVQGHEILTTKANGTPLWCLVSLQKMIYDGQPALIAGLHDITDRKHTAEELERARNAAEVASRAKSIFLANLTHEVRTPVMAVLGAAEASAKSSQSTGDEVNHADIISRNARHLLSLFDNMLDVARLEAGKFAVHPVQCSLLKILSDVRWVAHLPHQKPSVDFRLYCEGPIPRRIRTDPLRLKQAAINLVNNAMKFTSAGHVHMRVRTHLADDDPALVIEVEDTGTGIPESDRERIFDAFEQLEPRPGLPSMGVGLGLSLARSIAKELGGTLVLQSQEGRGSTFTLCVPTGPVDEVEWITPGEIGASAEPSVAEPHVSGRHEITGHVLLAEDSRDARTLIAQALREAGATLTAVENGKQAVEATAKQTYDLILMDIRMPIMDGVAAVLELRRRGCLAPIIALTASTSKDNQHQILEAGFEEVWDKPMSLRRVVERASDYLRSPATRTENSPQDSPARGSLPMTDARRSSVVAGFARNLPARFQVIRTAVDNGDLQAAREVLHQLAGTGGMMGFMRLSEQAGRVLSRIKAGAGADVEHQLEALKAVIDEIAQRATENAESSADPIR